MSNPLPADARRSLFVGSVLMLLGVGAGAFGAHGLKALVSTDALAVFQTGVLYHLVHALALVAVGLLQRVLLPSRALQAAAILFLVGVLLFSGSLYLLVVTGTRILGVMTPLGGVCFLLGWGLVAAAVWRAR